MKIYILGIGGTFMSGIAQLAKEKGYEVHGCDQKLYHPMDKVLQRASIKVDEGYDEKNLPSNIDIFVIGNVISRGNPLMEYILTKGYRYCSGPDFLYEHILRNKHVIAVSGTHGKTSVSAMTSKIFLDQQPKTGYLIAGETKDFPSSSKLGTGDFFVLEADEYDSAFFDKRSKFIHYRPKTLLINNLEFDHADIFNDLSDIQKQYSQLLRTLASDACVIYPNSDLNIEALFEKDFFSKTRTFSFGQDDIKISQLSNDGSKFEVFRSDESFGEVNWELIGEHNLSNALASLTIADDLGLDLSKAVKSLSSFKGVSRRMELLFSNDEIHIYDDFAHHPTAIKKTIEGLRNRVGSDPVHCLLEMRSNTMSGGFHDQEIPSAVEKADFVHIFSKNKSQALGIAKKAKNIVAEESVESFLSKWKKKPGHYVCFSNGSFDEVHQKLIKLV